MSSDKFDKGPANPQLKDALAACRGSLAAVVVFSLCINVLMLTTPLYMLQIFDRVLSSRSAETLIVLSLIAAAAILTLALLEMVRTNVMVRLSSWLEKKIGGAILAGSVTMTLRAGTEPSVQGLRDLSSFRSFLTGPGIFAFFDAPFTPIFIAVIFLLHPMLGWISLIGAIVLFVFALANEIWTRKIVVLAGRTALEAVADAESAVRNADAIEAMGITPALIRRWHGRNTEAVDLQARASNRSGVITGLSRFIRLGLQVGVLGAGAWLVVMGQLSAGAMIAASIIMGRALAPVEQAIGASRSAITARNAYQRIKRQLQEAPVRGRSMPLPAPKGHLKVEGVAHVHPNASEPVLRNINFHLESGEALGLVGPSAAGKTTLARLLVGNLQPRAGHVRLDGADVGQWDPEDLGRYIGYLPQDVELFRGTVQENIARMDGGSPEAVVEAARLAGVHEMILQLPHGYETKIGWGGAALSGGERQRIALARAVYGNPAFVVLDEPNASLDKSGVDALLSAVNTLRARGITQIIIAHQPSILRQVDKLLVLRDGMVEMFGPREDVFPKFAGPELARGGQDEEAMNHG